MLPPIRRLLISASSLLLTGSSGAVVINEIHYNPPDNTVRQEFIELYNPGATEVNLTGWRISGAVTYPFPADTRIPAGDFLVIAEDPATVRGTFRTVAIGPYAGNLDSEGETVRLRNQADALVDEADYKVGFPWPVASNGNGPSIELINPSLDNSLGSSWRASAPDPTPGEQNSVFAANAAPNIRKVFHTPQQPTDADDVVVTALITDPDGVATVTLDYNPVTAGRYVPSHLPNPIVGNNISNLVDRAENPSYESRWRSVAMHDDGIDGDALAGDGFFSVTIAARSHRELVRYRITVEDSLGLSARVPYPDDPSLNFACFIYNGVPAYEGIAPETLQTLPVYHLLTRAEDYDECFAYNSADHINQGSDARFFYNWSGTLVSDGVVYDNIRYRLRGANGRYHQLGKRSMRFRLNDGYFFQARDQSGNLYPKKWRTLTTGKGFDNHGTLTYGLNEAVSLHLFNKSGVPGSRTHWIHWRVIDEAAEAPDRWYGDFQGLNFVLETYDIRFLEAHGLEKGNLYKLINQTQDWRRQQRYQAPFGAKNGQDHNNIESQLTSSKDAAYIDAHVNLDSWNHSHALVEAIRHYDYWPSANKNMAYYFEPVYLPENGFNGKLWILPWDTDASWGPTWNSGQDAVWDSVFGSQNNSQLWPEYYNNVRELRDLLWQPDQLEPLIDEFVRVLRPLEAADALRWKGAPANAGTYNGLGGAGTVSLGNLAQDMKNFAFVGGNWPGGGVGAGGRAAHLDNLQGSRGGAAEIPATPAVRYAGPPDFPTNGLVFQSSRFSDPQGGNTFGAMEWRVARITDPAAPAHDPAAPFKLEWEADWESGEITPFKRTLNLPTTAVQSGLTYRVRLRHKDDTGRWSHWSAPTQFTTTLPDISPYRAGLVISEIMYHPTDPTAAEFAAGFTNDDDFEFIEILNVGPVPLDLTELRFTKGVDFDFLGSDLTSLAPGEFALIVANRAAVEMRYGAGLPIAGDWDPNDKLDNGGERLKLSFGAGDPILDFSYDDLAPWPTAPDGDGESLTLIAPNSLPDHGLAANWRSSTNQHGSPGTDESASAFEAWLAAEGASDPAAPFRGSSLSNLLAYSLGADLAPSPESALPVITTVDEGGLLYPALRYRTRQSAPELTFVVEISEQLVSWESGAALTVEVGSPQDNGDGTVSATDRAVQTVSALPGLYLRLRVSLAP